MQTGHTELEDKSPVRLLATTKAAAGRTSEIQNTSSERRAEQWTDQINAESLVHRITGNRQRT